MAYMFKQYMRVIGRWPKDKFKGDERNLVYFMERELEKIFKHSDQPPEAGLCERRLKGLIFLSFKIKINLQSLVLVCPSLP